MATRAQELQERTKRFAIRTVRFCRTLPNTPEGRTVRGQLIDCATSVGSNYRSTCRSRSRAEFVARIGVVVEETDESVYWLETALALELGDQQEAKHLLAETRQLLAIVAASQDTAKTNLRNRPTGSSSSP